jgi:hypothetical protein
MASANSYEDYVEKYFSENQAHHTENTHCPICLEHFDSGLVVKTHCGHAFHKTCVLIWLENNKQCPMCRTVLWQSLIEFANKLEIHATTEIDQWIGSHIDRDILELLPGTLLSIGRNETLFVEASRQLYELTKPYVPESQISFINIIRKSSIVVRMLYRCEGDLNAREWWHLMKELDQHRKEVAALDPAPEDIIEGMKWSGTEIWDAIIVVKNTIFEFCDLSFELISKCGVSYCFHDGSPYIRSRGQYSVDMRRPVVLHPEDMPLIPESADHIPQTNAVNSGDPNDSNSVEEHDLEIDQLEIAPFLKDVSLTAHYDFANRRTQIRLALRYPDAILNMAPIDDNSIGIMTKEGYELILSYEQEATDR